MGSCMPRSNHRLRGFLAASLLACAGCTSYRADPLNPAAELAAFTRRDLTTAVQGTGSASSAAQGFAEPDLVAIALRLNPDLVVSRTRRGVAEAALITAGTWPNPEFGLAIRGGSPGVTADLDLLAVLLRPGERGARKASAEATQRETLAQIAAEEWQVVGQVRSARLDLLSAIALRQAAQDTADLSRRGANALEKRRALGDVSDLEVATIGTEAASAERSLREAIAAVASRARALNRLLGLPVDLRLPVAGSGEPLAMIDVATVVPADLGMAVLHGRLDLVAAQAAYDRTEHELRLAISKQYPALRIGPSASRDGDGTTIGGAVSLEVPIFDRNQGGIRAAETARDEARARFQAALQHALADAGEAAAAVRTASAEVTALDTDLMPVARRALDLADRAVQARDMGVIDYLAVRRLWLDAQRARLEAVTAAHRAQIALDAALGRGSAALARPITIPLPAETPPVKGTP